MRKRPSFVTREHLEFLDKFQEQEKTNEFGAILTIKKEFSLSTEQANQIFSYWLVGYNQEDNR